MEFCPLLFRNRELDPRWRLSSRKPEDKGHRESTHLGLPKAKNSPLYGTGGALFGVHHHFQGKR